MKFRSWLCLLVAAVVLAAAALVIANVYHHFGSRAVALVVNGLWVVGSAGALVSLVALIILGLKHRRQPRG